MLDFVVALCEAEGMEEIGQKRLGDSSTTDEMGGKRIKFDNEDHLSNNEEKQPETAMKEKEKEIEKLRQQLALRIESEETIKANYDELVSQLAAKSPSVAYCSISTDSQGCDPRLESSIASLRTLILVGGGRELN